MENSPAVPPQNRLVVERDLEYNTACFKYVELSKRTVYHPLCTE